MDWNIAWTTSAVDAEVERYGTARLCAEHNKLMGRVAALEKLVDRIDENEVLDKFDEHKGNRARVWSTTGVWLYPGDMVVVLRA